MRWNGKFALKGNDLLILAAIDLADGLEWFAEDWGRAVQAMALGKAGDVSSGRTPAAAFASRAARPRPGMPVRTRGKAFARQVDGSFTLFAGMIHEPDDLARRWNIARYEDFAGLYAAIHARHGDRCDSFINGDYAVIQWFPEERRARLARSPTSRAPLHVMRDGHRLVVSTVPGPILALGHHAEVDDAMLGDWLLLNSRRPAQSWYKGLHRVPAAMVETHDPGGFRSARYWSVEDVPEVRFKRDEDYVEAVAEQFRNAAAATLVDAQQPGIMLSGGLDSQAVASFAIECLPPGSPLKSYTSVPSKDWVPSQRERAFGDETPHVRALCAMYPQIDPSFVDGCELRFGERLHASMLLSGWPVYNEMNSHWSHAAFAKAEAAGVDVMLVGDMGNAGFSYDGLTGFPTWLRQLQWPRLFRELATYDYDDRPLWRKFLALSVMPHVPLALKQAIDRHRKWRVSPFKTWCPMRADYAVRSGALGRALADRHDVYDYGVTSARDWREDVVTGHFGGTPEIAMGLTLHYGMPLRDPNGYLPLMELCLGIGDEQYLRGGVDRWLARRLLQGRVPDMVRNERRIGLQSSDWPLRLARERDLMLAELQAMESDPRLAEVLDLQRLAADLQNWDGQDIPARRDAAKLNSGVSRGISTARFVKFVEGRNAG